MFSGAAGKTCAVVTRGRKLLSTGKRLVSAGKKLVGGHLGGAARTLLGSGGGSDNSSAPTGSSTASTAIGLAALGAWVTGGAEIALHETAKVLGDTTRPQLTSTWFSATYWRMAAIGAVLTVPFLFAAAVQALVRSDLALLARAALGYLPLSLLAVSVAAPLTMLLLAASDEMSAIVAAAAGNAGVRYLDHAGVAIGALTILSGSPFLAFLVGLFTAAGALVLWLELLMREAAVYVIVLMLPLVFAAFVWPARRVWATRAIELLVALILSKFAIVAVLALGGAALSESTDSLTGSLAGIVLLMMGAFAPWALLRLIPLSELASGAMSSLRTEGRAIRAPAAAADAGARAAHARWGEDWAAGVTAGMRRQAEETPGLGSSRDRVDGPPSDQSSEPVEITSPGGPIPEPGDGSGPGGGGSGPGGGGSGPGGGGPGGGGPSTRGGSSGPDGSSSGSGGATAPTDSGAAPTDSGAAPTGTGAPPRPFDGPPAIGGPALPQPDTHAAEPSSSRPAPPTPGSQTGDNAGIGPLLRAPDNGWRELNLGLDEGWPPAPLWPAQRSDDPALAPDGSGAGDPHASDAPRPTDGGAADHGRRPPAQEPGEGQV